MYGFSNEGRAEAAARDVLFSNNLEIPLDLSLVINIYDIKYQERTLSEGFDGMAAIVGGVKGIMINSLIQSEGRKRFTLAHEIGHLLIDGHFTNREKFECTPGDIGSYSKDDEFEKEANEFASELLMPSEKIKADIRYKNLSFKLFEEVAMNYKVSLTAAAVKCVKLDSDASAFIFLKNGKVQWTYGSKLYFWDIKKKPNSSALFNMIKNKESEMSGTVESYAWANKCKYKKLKETGYNYTTHDVQLVLLTVEDEEMDVDYDWY